MFSFRFCLIIYKSERLVQLNKLNISKMCANTLPCPLCEQPNFQSIDSLRISLVNVTNRPLICPICCDVLYGLDKLTIHLFSHSLNENKPTDTEYFTTNADLSTQSNKNKIESFRNENTLNHLNQISLSLNKTDPLNQHNQSPNVEPHCDICGSSFRSAQLYRMHLKLVHEVSDETTQHNGAMIGEKDLKNTFPCHLCSKLFKMKGSLRVHLKVVHSFGKTGRIGIPILDGYQQATVSCSNASETRVADGILCAENKLNNVEVKAWECDICAKSFTTKYFLKKHKRLHTGEMPYSCEICGKDTRIILSRPCICRQSGIGSGQVSPAAGKNFTFQQSYHKHLLYHSDEKPHICSTCGRAFKELSTLHNHERIHSGEKPFQCETCDKCFRQRVSYLVHRRIHTGSMPYKCTACDKSFRYKVSQRTHRCLAEPPGTVIRQTGDLLQKLIQSVSLGNTVDEHIDITDKDFLNQSLDEFVKESCDKIGIGDDGNISFQDGATSIPIEVQIPSPSEKFQSMCLYSPTENVTFSESLELYGDDDNVGL